jgi:hypothetical protein
MPPPGPPASTARLATAAATIRILARACIRILWRAWNDGKTYNLEQHAAAKSLNLLTQG